MPTIAAPVMTTCPACGAPAYVCTQPHTDGPGPRLHCHLTAAHTFTITLPED